MAAQPDRATCDAVDERDQQRCVHCGALLVGGSRHHRKLRRFNDHTTQNLILLCGSGTTGCHGWVHGHPSLSYKLGLMLNSWHSPLAVPVKTWRGWRLLVEHGGFVEIDAHEAEAIMRELGIE